MRPPRATFIALAVSALFAAADGRADNADADLTFYVDTETKQVFTEPGPNRRPLGTFRRVEAAPAAPVSPQPGEPAEAATPASADPSPAMAEPAVPREEAFEQRMEARQRRLEERVDKLAVTAPPPAALTPKRWYDSLSIRGYLQVRHHTTLSGDRDIRAWNDSAIGEDRGFLIRRARVIISGDVSERLFVYIQPDFATTAGDTGNVGQLRDFYGDYHFDSNKEFRLRLGQSKIPYSFEDLQSSQNRLALDRNDALNSCCLTERDLGAFFYYAPSEKRALFRELVRDGLKGSGDYGVFAFGAYNGQGANRSELNDNLHMVARFTYPFKTESGQIYEFGVAGHSGNYVPATDGRIAGLPVNLYRDRGGFRDRRVALHAVMYPQPFGLQAEWNWGEGPALNDARTAIETQSLNGGYVQTMYKIDKWAGRGTLIPFVRWQYFDGAMKFLNNAPQTRVNDWEFGIEWQPDPNFEVVLVYQRYNRTNVTVLPYAMVQADVLRMQLQYNY